MEPVVQSFEEATKNPFYREALVDLLFILADDDLILGHRDSEWLGLAPEIEEDVAFSSIAQDEVGHAAFYYGLLSDLGEGKPDELAYERPATVRRNASLVERDNGDWAYTVVRHLFYDVFETIRLRVLTQSNYLPLAQGAAKILREEYYHRLHMETLFKTLASAGGEARVRMERAVSAAWSDIASLFDFGPHVRTIRQMSIMPVDPDDLMREWLHAIHDLFSHVSFSLPQSTIEVNGERSKHSDELRILLTTMSEVYGLDRTATW